MNATMSTAPGDEIEDPKFESREPYSKSRVRGEIAEQQLPGYVSYLRNKLVKDQLLEDTQDDLRILFKEVSNCFLGRGPFRSTLERTYELTDGKTREKIEEKYRKYQYMKISDLLDMLRVPTHLSPEDRDARLEALGLLLLLTDKIRVYRQVRWTKNGYSPF